MVARAGANFRLDWDVLVSGLSGTYSAIGHNHDASYSALGHTHVLANVTDAGVLAAGSDAGDVPFTPAGAIVATDVQAAIVELDSEKSATSHTHALVDITDAGALAALNTVGTTQIDAAAVTYAKIQNVSATDKLLGRSTAGAGSVEEIICTAAGRALLDDAAASDQRTTLGLGTIATQDANSVSLSGGSITGITDLAVADGGTGASDAATARDNLDVPHDLSVMYANRLINGEFRFWQRGTSLSAQADDSYGAMGDRWYILTQTSTIAGARQDNPFNGARFSGQLTQSQASAQRIGVAQIIEGKNCIDLRGQAVTFYGRFKISADQDVRVAILEWTGTEDAVTSDFVLTWTSTTYTAGNFFTTTSTTVTAVQEYATPGTGWVDFFVTGTLGSSLNNICVMLWTEGTAAQNVTLSMANCGLIRGSAAPAAHAARPYSFEYLLCCRYYYKTFDIDTTPAQNIGEQEFAWAMPQIGGAASGGRASDHPFPVRMRATPTITSYNPAAANNFWRNTEAGVDSTTVNMGGVSARRLRSQWTTGAGTAASQINHIHFTAEVEL